MKSTLVRLTDRLTQIYNAKVVGRISQAEFDIEWRIASAARQAAMREWVKGKN
jgi:hypothetical protein